MVGDRQVRLQDRKNLPYTDAVLHEIQRMSNTVPSVLRCASRDVTFQDYFIKKVINKPSSAVHRLSFHGAFSGPRWISLTGLSSREAVMLKLECNVFICLAMHYIFDTGKNLDMQ